MKFTPKGALGFRYLALSFPLVMTPWTLRLQHNPVREWKIMYDIVIDARSK
jgi:hypothetical protein